MNDLRKAAEMALEALRYTCDHLPAKTGVEREVDDAITALQIALVKPEWVGLTEQERNDLDDYCEMIIGKAAFDAITAKLKEKNCG